MSTLTPSQTLLRATVLNENCKQSPTKDELHSYAKSLGVDLAKEPELLEIVYEGILAPLPKGWQVLQDENNDIFYYHAASGQSLWEHPQDAIYRRKIKHARAVRHQQSTHSPRCCSPSRFADGSLNHSVTPGLTKVEHTSTPADVQVVVDTRMGGSAPSTVKDFVKHSKKEEHVACSASENELPTEYLELVLSRSTDLYPRSLNGFPSSVNRSVLTQTVESDSPAYHDTTLKCKKVDNGTFPTQNTVLTDRNNSTVQQSSSIPGGAGYFWSKRSSFTFNSPKMSPTPHTSSTQLHHGICLNSPTHPDENDLVVNEQPTLKGEPTVSMTCPELGASPSEHTKVKYSTQSTANDPVDYSPYCGFGDTKSEENQPVESQAPNTPIPTMSLNRSRLSQIPEAPANHRDTAAATSMKQSMVEHDFNDGLSHLVEERSRLQRKMLRIKLIYKTFKQRLASLDSSLRILQQQHPQPNAVVNLTPPSTEGVDKQTERCPTSTPCSVFDLPAVSPYSSPARTHVLPKMVQPEIITIEECGEPDGETTTRNHLSGRHDSALITSRSSYSIRPSTSCVHSTRIPHDLASSLVSIDSHLHRVLSRLESTGDDSAVCDMCARERNGCRSLETACSKAEQGNTLEEAMQNLSVRLPQRARRSVLGDVRLLTPMSSKHGAFEQPSLDASQTWLN